MVIKVNKKAGNLAIDSLMEQSVLTYLVTMSTTSKSK
jgi:hypothetical protein